MRKIRATHRSKVMALLEERLEFERAAVELYAAVLDKLESRGGAFDSVRAHLRCILEEERAHEEWLAEQLSALGGTIDAAAPPRVRGEWRRIGDQVLAAHDPADLFVALREVEMLDSAGWELLRELAERAQDDEARAAFGQRAREEAEHLLFVNRMAAILGNSELLDEALTTIEEPVIA